MVLARQIADQQDRLASQQAEYSSSTEEQIALAAIWANMWSGVTASPLLPEDMLDNVVADIRRWEARKLQAEQQLADAGQPRNMEEINDAVAAVEAMLNEFEDAALDNDREALRAMLRRRIAWVEINVKATPCGTKGYSHYELTGGRVVLKPEGPLPDMVNRQGPLELAKGDKCVSLFSTDRNIP